MRGEAVAGLVAEGEAALKTGDWERARNSFQAVLAEEESPEALDGFGRAMWWAGHVDDAIGHRARAYVLFRRRGEDARAARVALWLAREYEQVHANDPVANGWRARAQRLLAELPPGLEHGWLSLSRAAAATAPSEVERLSTEALEVAKRHRDPDLEIRALARIGLALVSSGRVDEGLTHLDEAMAAASSEAMSAETFAETCCDMLLACELAMDVERFGHWGTVVERFSERGIHGPLLAFCGSCCAELFVSSGDLAQGEHWLTFTLETLRRSGHRARCVEPAARLAELRVLQGRYEEAEALLHGYEDRPEALSPTVALHLARGETALAAALLHRKLNSLGADSLLSVPHLARLVEVQLVQGDLDHAKETAGRLAALATQTAPPRVAAHASLAAGRVGRAVAGDDAVTHLEAAIAAFGELRMPLETARAHLELANALVTEQPELAVAEGKAALEALEEIGATHEADEAASLLRSLGTHGRTGPKGLGLLTRREREVLELLGAGLTNAEIAARLYVSPKTAGHHVSSILSKLHLRSRTEAATFALRHVSDPQPNRPRK